MFLPLSLLLYLFWVSFLFRAQPSLSLDSVTVGVSEFWTFQHPVVTDAIASCAPLGVLSNGL